MTVPVTPLHHAGDKATGTQVTPRRSAVSGVFILSPYLWRALSL
ncbi:hypothetical protein ECXG_04226 [Escherichia coli TA447]|uniref:Uncharacterized protein n=1 Tax=Escherichia coli TA447 TaxID=656447 RepID=A0A1X3IT86_ECOLX|nr:hypothetical protein ECXG_04226 [Escherichia coli TA447]